MKKVLGKLILYVRYTKNNRGREVCFSVLSLNNATTNGYLDAI